MQNPQRRPEGCRQYADPVPSEAILLRALPQGAQPHPLEATHKPVEGPEAGWHCVVTQPSAHDPTKPFGDLMDVVMHSPAQFGLDALQGPIDALADRLATQSETSLPSGPAIVREPEEVESLRTPFPPCPAVRHREFAELNETGLVRVQLEREVGQPVLQIAQEPFCIPLVLEPDNEIIGVTHDDRLATGDPGAPLPLEPEVKDEVQVDVRQNRLWEPYDYGKLSCCDR